MSALATRHDRSTPRPFPGWHLLGVSLVSIAIGATAVRPTDLRLVVAGVVVLAAVAVAFVNRRHALYLLVVWMSGLGMLRRLVSEVAPTQGRDVLLLVGPATLAVLFLLARPHQPRRTSALTRAVAVLVLLSCLEALNPLQGSVAAGAAGLLFVPVPMLAFWVGRSLSDTTFARMLKLVGLLALAAAAYGLFQTTAGFPSWDERWIHSAGASFGALHIGDTVRPFSAFSSFAEYSTFLGIGVVVWVANARGLFGRLLSLGTLTLLGIALVLSSTRSAAVTAVVALAVIFAARRRLSSLAALGVAVVALALVPTLASQIPKFQGEGSALSTHLVEGLQHPLDPNSSTLLHHVDLVRSSVSSVVTHPAGLGLSAITLAGDRFGGASANAEADPGNAAAGLGLPGLAAYLAALLLAFGLAYRVARRRADALSLAALGILCVTIFQWLNGGQYAVAYLVWLTLGWIDRAHGESSAKPLG